MKYLNDIQTLSIVGGDGHGPAMGQALAGHAQPVLRSASPVNDITANGAQAMFVHSILFGHSGGGGGRGGRP
jgi:hypothetical protein